MHVAPLVELVGHCKKKREACKYCINEQWRCIGQAREQGQPRVAEQHHMVNRKESNGQETGVSVCVDPIVLGHGLGIDMMQTKVTNKCLANHFPLKCAPGIYPSESDNCSHAQWSGQLFTCTVVLTMELSVFHIYTELTIV